MRGLLVQVLFMFQQISDGLFRLVQLSRSTIVNAMKTVTSSSHLRTTSLA
jgi:hypothetical protein